MIRELESVVLDIDMPDSGLKRGDIGTVVMVHGGGAAFEVEFITLSGETVSVAMLQADQLRPIADDEIACARVVASGGRQGARR